MVFSSSFLFFSTMIYGLIKTTLSCEDLNKHMVLTFMLTTVTMLSIIVRTQEEVSALYWILSMISCANLFLASTSAPSLGFSRKSHRAASVCYRRSLQRFCSLERSFLETYFISYRTLLNDGRLSRQFVTPGL